MKARLTLAALAVALSASFGVASAADTAADQAAAHNHAAERGGYAAAPVKAAPYDDATAATDDKTQKTKRTKMKVTKHNHAAERGGYSGPSGSPE